VDSVHTPFKKTKTIVAENIIKGPLTIENKAGASAKVIVANNADDGPDDKGAY
jgi:hypothetical protein